MLSGCQWLRRRRGLKTSVVVTLAFVIGTVVFLLNLRGYCLNSFPQDFCNRYGGLGQDHGLEDLRVVTYGSRSYFDRLQNLVGSFHFWEPDQTITVYDLGLTVEQKLKAACWSNVELLTFPFDKYPDHVRNGYNFAWKILILSEMLEKHKTVILFDSGLEIRQPLGAIKRKLARDSFFSIIQSNWVGLKTHKDMFKFLGLHKNNFVNAHFCAAGLLGLVRDGPAANAIVGTAKHCALNEACIDPPGANSDNHNFDQSVISALLSQYHFECTPRKVITSDRTEFLNFDETRCVPPLAIGVRRWQLPYPFLSHVTEEDPAECSRKQKDVSLLSNSFYEGKRLKPGEVECLRRTHNGTSCHVDGHAITTDPDTKSFEQRLRMFFGMLRKWVVCAPRLQFLSFIGVCLLVYRHFWWRRR